MTRAERWLFGILLVIGVCFAGQIASNTAIPDHPCQKITPAGVVACN
jgi:hypothetical protein